jgi:hypothetical protein
MPSHKPPNHQTNASNKYNAASCQQKFLLCWLVVWLVFFVRPICLTILEISFMSDWYDGHCVFHAKVNDFIPPDPEEDA